MSKDSKKSDFGGNVINTLNTKVFLLVFGLIANIINARILGPEALGYGILLLFFPPLFARLLNFGTAGSIYYFLGHHPEDQKKYIGTTLYLGLIVAAVSTLLFWGLSDYLLSAFYNDAIPLDLYWLVIFTTPLPVFQLYIRVILRASNLIKDYNFLMDTLPTILRFSLIIVLVAIVKLDVYGFVFANLTVSLVSVVLMGRVLLKRVDYGTRFNWRCAKNMFSYGIRLYPTSITNAAEGRLENSLIGIYLSAADVGVYNIAVSFANRLKILESVLAVPLLPHLSRLKRNEAQAFSVKILNALFAPSCLLSLAFILIGPWFIEFAYGEAYSGAVSPMIFLALAAIPSPLSRVINDFFVAQGQPIIRSIIQGVNSLLKLSLMLVLLEPLMTVGCALSVMLAEIITFGLWLTQFKKTNALGNPSMRIFIWQIKPILAIYPEILGERVVRLPVIGKLFKTP